MSLFSFLKKSPKAPTRLKLPSSWLPSAKMRRIHLHWTAGSHVASALDKEHYHFLVEIVDGKVRVVRGKLPVNANVPPLREGRYAAHTYRANSWSIGIAICGMAGATTNPLRAGKHPITREQWDEAVSLIASLARHYGIEVSSKTILTHAEVTKNLGIRQRGKWDIAYLPFWKSSMSAHAIGNKLRNEVAQLV